MANVDKHYVMKEIDT